MKLLSEEITAIIQTALQEKKINGQFFLQAPLSDYSSLRVGGPAERLYIPASLDDLAVFLSLLPSDESLTWLGLGSNTLIRDGGLQGTVIITQGYLNQLTIIDNHLVRVEAGVACPTMARFCARAGLEGAEFLAGIPGTMGGALAMNAGCHGGETWDLVTAVETLDRNGNKHLRTPKEYKIAYRSVQSENQEWFVAGHFRLVSGSKEQSLEKIRSLLAYRASTQPTSEPSCGSVFRNPPDNHAGHLVETAGLKGLRIGGATVSTKHANFIVNEGTATAKDIESLIEQVMATVKEKYQIDLIREVHILGKDKS